MVSNKAVSRLDGISKAIGIANTLIDASVSVSNYNQGKSWGENAIHAGIGAIGLIGMPGLIIAITLDSYFNGFMFLYEHYLLFEQQAPDWMKAKIVPGYRF